MALWQKKHKSISSKENVEPEESSTAKSLWQKVKDRVVLHAIVSGNIIFQLLLSLLYILIQLLAN